MPRRWSSSTAPGPYGTFAPGATTAQRSRAATSRVIESGRAPGTSTSQSRSNSSSRGRTGAGPCATSASPWRSRRANSSRDVEPVRIGEQPVDRAHADDAGARACGGERHPGADLAEALDRDRGAVELSAAVGERGLGGGLDAVAGGEVVHVDALVALRPQRRRALQRVREVGRRRAHVGPGEEDVAVGLERAPVRGHDVLARAAREPHARLGAGVGHAPDRELPGHRAREARHLADVDVRQHPRPARRDRELVVVDDHEGLQTVVVIAELDHAHAVSLLPQ